MTRTPSLPTTSSSSRITLTMAALCVGAGALFSITPAAASPERAVVCLSGDNTSDCGFTSLAQCEATASGGLGVCNVVSSGLPEHPRAVFSRGHAK